MTLWWLRSFVMPGRNKQSSVLLAVSFTVSTLLTMNNRRRAGRGRWLPRDGLWILLAVLVGCSDNRPSYSASWATSRSTSGDTTIVRTENADADAGLRTLVPLVTIGQTGDTPEYTFGHISHVASAPNGNIWVFDSRARALRMYDGSGKFIRSYGWGTSEQRCAREFWLLR